MKDKVASYTMESTAPGEMLIAVIDGINPEEADQVPLKVVVDKGLPTIESKYQTTAALESSLSVSSPEKLQITDAVGEYDNMTPRIHIFTTQSVDFASAQQAIKIDPKLPFTLEQAYNGFYINGAFNPGSMYHVEIATTLKGFLGGNLPSAYTSQVSFGEMEPSLSFVNKKGIYLSSKSSRNLALNVVNIPKVHVTIYRIYENNITHFLNSNRYSDGWYDDDGEYYDEGSTYNIYGVERYGDPILDRIYDTKDLATLNNIKLLNLSFEDVSSYKGIYLVTAYSSEDQWRRATKLVSVSDLGLMVKETSDEYYVFVNSIKSAEPMSDVNVNLISSNNQVIASAKSGRDGVAVFKDMKSRMGRFRTSMVTASADKDFNYVPFSENRVNSSRFDVGGRRVNDSKLMAFVYGDRDIYRPGEKVNLNTIVRTEDWIPFKGIPVKIIVYNPGGSEFKVVRGTLSQQGAFTTSFDLPEASLTGNYSVDVFSSNDVRIASYSISVEEFLPDRIDVKLSTSKTELGNGDSLKVNLVATNLFGPPAADRKYEMTFNVNRSVFRSKYFSGYNFDIPTRNSSALRENDIREGKTDAKGEASELFASDASWADQGLLSAKCFATVTDETGRTVNRALTFPIYTQKVFYGIKMNDYYVNRGEKFDIPLVACSKDGKGVATEGRVQIIRYDWYYTVESRGDGGYHYLSKKKEVLLSDMVVNIPSTGMVYTYIPRESGEYEIRVRRPDAETYVASNFYSYGWGYTSNSSFEVSTEGEVDIQPDKNKYQVNDKAKLIFKTPFNGKLLVTIECDKVIEYRYLKTENRSAFLEVPLKDSYLPNIYVTATLFRPLDEGSIPLTVAHGFIPLIVEKPSTKIPVSIECVEKSRSRTKQTIKVKAAPNTELTVAVVDEGILALHNYKTPDPFGFFYQKKALMVDAYDVYAALLPDLKLRRSSTGGDAMFASAMGKRVNPMNNKRVKLVSMWSGILKTNSSGEASYTINVPQFSGDLRVMACAYKDGNFGSGDKHMKVADPIVISPSIPRFLSPGDSLYMPVTITNTTSKPAMATATVNVSGNLIVSGSGSEKVEIPANGEKRVNFKIASRPAVGYGKIVVVVNSMNENFSDSTDITIRPPSSLLKVSSDGEITATGTIDMTNDFVPSSVDAKITISQNPMVRFGKSLSYLIGYPYGCVEQTTSKAFPQLYFSDLVKNMRFGNSSGESPVANVQAAITKLQGMQLYNGSLSYWPGMSEETWWGTNYAIHFLIEARKAGYEVNNDVIQNALSYMAQKVKEHRMEEHYYYYSYNKWETKRVYSKENLYSLFLMALYGKADVATMNFFKSNLSMLALDSKYLLACAYLAIGERKAYEEVLPKSFEGEESARCFGGSFYSYLRDESLALSTLLDVDPDNVQIPIMVRHLSQQINKETYLNTQEAAFSFLALGKFMRRISQENVTATVMVDGAKIADYTGGELVIKKGIAGKKVQVSVSGKGKLFYFTEMEGLSVKNTVKEEDRFLKVRKTFYNRFGQPINVQNVKQGDIIAVKLTVENLEKSSVDNVAITDILPAGFEIENPRIGEVADMTWIKDMAGYQYMDVRDDRITFFTSEVNMRPKAFYYVTRAVSTGKYLMGPASADAMYNGEYHSYNGAQTVVIR
ncbi:MAG: MG2 domain-containing protein [Bacteroidia bacterium]